jgi:PAS domain S-box-containing protein
MDLFEPIANHLVLVSFFYGAVFVLLGTVIFSQRIRVKDYPLAAHMWLLALFGLGQGVAEWMTTWMMVRGMSDPVFWSHLALESVSLVSLFEFGRRSWLDSLGLEEMLWNPSHPLGPLLHLLPALAVVAGLSLSLETLDAHLWMNYVLAVPAAFIAATGMIATLWLQKPRRVPDATAPYFVLSAVGVALFGFLGAATPVGAKVLLQASLGATAGVSLMPLVTLGLLSRALAAVLVALGSGRIMFIFNVTVRDRMFAAVQEASRSARMILDAAGEGIIEVDRRGMIQFCNPAAAQLLGTSADQLTGKWYHALMQHSMAGGEPYQPGDSPIQNAIRLGQAHRGNDQVFWREDGSSFSVEHTCTPLVRDGEAVGAVITFSDISHRKLLDKLLRDTQAVAKIGGWEMDLASGSVSWTEEVYRIHDLPLNSTITPDSVMQFLPPESKQAFSNAIRNAVDKGESFDLELSLVTASRREIWVRVIGQPYGQGGSGPRLVGTYQDITERKAQEHVLKDTRDFYELILDSVPIRIAHVRADGRIGYVNRSYENWFARHKSKLVGKHISEVVSPDAYREIKPNMKRALKGDPVTFQASLVHNNEQVRLAVHYLPNFSRDGEINGFFSVVQDVTDYKELEAKLVQAQKMEAVGQLTGGLAHDFNNLLGVILGNLQLLERPLRRDEKLHKKVKTATRAAMRGADLTRRLLAFSRRQMLEPKVVDLNRLLGNLDELIRRTLGEGVDIETDFSEGVWSTTVDPSQLETAILNLAINARDAMQQEGRISISTGTATLGSAQCKAIGNLEPGDYSTVTVADSGCGMSPEVLSQVFEPFFTTKDVGKGSGLGLSMVYGFVEQSGGGVKIESQLGQGTVVTLYLPRAHEMEVDPVEETAIHRFMPGGDELILVAEDEEDVRETVVTLLGELGYEILEAANGPDALRHIESRDDIDLLFSDVRMPGGLHGPDLARMARDIRPGLKVLFTSGYAEGDIMQRGDLITGAEMIQKPYRNEELAVKLRALLDKDTSHVTEEPKSLAGY